MLKTYLFKSVAVIILLFALCCALVGCGAKPSEKTFKEAYENKIDTMIDEIGDYYGVVGDYDFQNMKVDADLNVELSEELLDFIRSYTSYDFEWINDAKLNFSETFKDEKIALAIGAAYGKNEIITAKAIMDIAANKILVGIPSLSETFLLQEALYEYNEAMSLFDAADVNAFLPDEKLLESVIKEIYYTVIENVEDVYIKEEVLFANGVEQDCIAYEVELSEKDVIRIAIDIFEMLEENGDFKKIIMELVKSTNGLAEEMGIDDVDYTSSEAYDYLIDAMDDIIGVLRDSLDYASGKSNITWTSYITKKLDVIGVKFEYDNDYDDKYTFFIAETQNKNDVGVEIYFKEGSYTPVKITGELTDNGRKRSGTYEIKVEGESMVFVDIENVDVKKLEDGYFVGALSISPSKGLRELILGGADFDFSMAGLSLSSLALRFDVKKNDGENFEMAVALMSGSEPYVSVNMKGSIKDGSKITLPEKTTDDAEEWIEEFDVDAFIKKAEKSGLPDYVVEILADIEYSFR